MKARIPAFLLALIVAFAANASVPPNVTPVALNELGKLKVGDLIQGTCHKAADEARRLDSVRQRAHFFVYLFSGKLPSRCMNLHCGPFAQRILARGGMLIGGADPDFMREAGVSDGGARAPASLMVVTDPSHRIRAIYQNVQTWELGRVLDQVSD